MIKMFYVSFLHLQKENDKGILVFENSLTMGLAYDNTDKCQCSEAVCIMNPEGKSAFSLLVIITIV